MLTPTVGAVDLSDDKIWGDFNGTSEVVELYSIVPPKVITVDMLKQLRCIDYATGKLTTLTPSGDEVLYYGDEFTFEVVTALCVDEISIEADGIYSGMGRFDKDGNYLLIFNSIKLY